MEFLGVLEMVLKDKFGGRRFLLAAGSGLMTGVLQWFGKLDLSGTAYGLVIGATVGSYIAGNVLERKHEGEQNDKQ
jgi:hypothetical protein